MDEKGLASAYESRLELLEECRVALEASLREPLAGVPHIDRITTRLKDVDSFVKKSTEEPNRYEEPLEEVEDQIGARVIAFFERDIPGVKALLRDRFNPVEDFRHEPPRDAEFGYLTDHLVFVIPAHLKPAGWADMDPMPTTFECQVRTLFMHAYAEPQHDISYKNAHDLTAQQRRQLAWIAASAWGADAAYERLLESLAEGRTNPT